MIIPPPAFSCATTSSTVGVVLRPRSTISMPKPCKVAVTNLETISPEILASLPIIILGFWVFSITHAPYAAVNLTTSMGVKLSPTVPPIVPRIPEIDFINATKDQVRLKFKNRKGILLYRWEKGLLKFSHYLIYFIIRVPTAGISIYRFTTVATGFPVFVQIWILRSTGSLELTVLQKYQADRHQNEEQSHKT